MVEIAYTNELSEQRTRVFKWAGVTEADQFQRVDLGGLHGDVTMILGGTPGGATFALEGAHEPAGPWVPVEGAGGGAIALTAAGSYASARDVFPFLRPRRSGGTGVDATITLAVTRAG